MKTDRLQGILFADEPVAKSTTKVSVLLQRTATLAGRLKHMVTHTANTPESHICPTSSSKQGNIQADDLLKRLRPRQ